MEFGRRINRSIDDARVCVDRYISEDIAYYIDIASLLDESLKTLSRYRQEISICVIDENFSTIEKKSTCLRNVRRVWKLFDSLV